jgi:hypothetical protein
MEATDCFSELFDIYLRIRKTKSYGRQNWTHINTHKKEATDTGKLRL